MKTLIIALLAITATVNIQAREHTESWYVDSYCTGQAEVINSDNTRTDCIVGDYAVEFDFASKWAECTGQALHYGNITGKTGTCALIIEKASDCKYLSRVPASVKLVTIDSNAFCGEVHGGIGLEFGDHADKTKAKPPLVIYKDKIVYKDKIIYRDKACSTASTVPFALTPKPLNTISLVKPTTTKTCWWVNAYTTSKGTYVKGHQRCRN